MADDPLPYGSIQVRPLMRALETVVLAWNDPGPFPSLHFRAQRRLRRHWPVLAEALDTLTDVVRHV